MLLRVWPPVVSLFDAAANFPAKPTDALLLTTIEAFWGVLWNGIYEPSYSQYFFIYAKTITFQVGGGGVTVYSGGKNAWLDYSCIQLTITVHWADF